MGMKKIIATAAAPLIALAIALATFGSSDPILTTAGPPYLETFDGTPTAPTAWEGAGWDVSHNIEHQNLQLPTMAQHGPGCEHPSNHHVITAQDNVAFQCNGHVMTALETGTNGYAAVYLMPNQLLDFSNGPATFSVDISTEFTSWRDWFDIFFTPYEDNVQLPGEDWYPDTGGLPRRGIMVGSFGGAVGAKIIENFAFRQFPNYPFDRVTGNTYTRWSSFLTPDRARRDRLEITISQTHLKISMPAYNFTWVDTDIAPLGYNKVMVQIGHHSYSSRKDCSASDIPGAATCLGNTWHWDNVAMSSAEPFTLVDSSPNAVAGPSAQVFNLDAAAPANAEVRFVSQGRNIEVSFNGGTTWVPAPLTPSGKPESNATQHSRRLPIPVGTTSVRVRGSNDIFGRAWKARDLSVISRGSTVSPTTTTAPSTTTTVAPSTSTTTTTTVPATTTTAPATTTTIPVTTTTAPATTTTTTPPLVCVINAPTAVTVTANGSGSVAVAWNYSGSKVYEVRFRKVGASTWRTRSASVISPYVISSLTPGAQYEVQVREVSPWSSTVTGVAG
jgi:hypothetical protein